MNRTAAAAWVRAAAAEEEKAWAAWAAAWVAVREAKAAASWAAETAEEAKNE